MAAGNGLEKQFSCFAAVSGVCGNCECLPLIGADAMRTFRPAQQQIAEEGTEQTGAHTHTHVVHCARTMIRAAQPFGCDIVDGVA